MKLNDSFDAETIDILITKEKFPILFKTKLHELMKNKCFDSEEDAIKWIESTPITLELYYEEDAGLFGVESEALDSCPETICSPYSREYFKGE